MARHASGKNNYALSGRAIAALVAVVALIGATGIYAATRGEDSAEQPAASCVAGDLSLPVAATDESVGRLLVDAYADTHPVVRDYCVQPQLVESVADAAVYIAPNTPVSHQELAQRNRTSAVADPQPVYAQKVGLASKDEVPDASAVEVGAVAFPVNDEPAASALVASVLAGNEQDAVQALTDHRVPGLEQAARTADVIATSEGNVPGGYSFSPLDASIVYVAIPLTQGDTVTEEQSRAGQDFASSAASRFDGDGGQQPTISEMVWAAASPTGGEAITDNTDEGVAVAEGGPTNTLFLLDTSDAMAPYMDGAQRGISAAAQGVADAERQVALWNYSSPLNPGVVNGYRRNVAMTSDAGEVVGSVNRFLTGGEPMTREAVLAAVSQTAESGAPARIVVVTSGTADGGDDEAFADAVTSAAGSDVTVSVVHVGEGQQDEALRRVSSAATIAKSAGDVEPAIAAAAGLTRS